MKIALTIRPTILKNSVQMGKASQLAVLEKTANHGTRQQNPIAQRLKMGEEVVTKHDLKMPANLLLTDDPPKLKGNNEKKHLCNICGFECASNSSLIIHKRKHTGEKPFKCQLCDKTFAHQNGFTVHQKTHQQSEYLSCHHCHKQCGSTSGLRYHMKTVHPHSDQLICEVCQYTAYSRMQLEIHKNYKNSSMPQMRV